MNDERFKHVLTDPKFRRIPKKDQKIKIDKRFQSMFKDKKFKVKYTTDKRGRPVNHNSTEDLKRYYVLSSEDESSSSESQSAPNKEKKPSEYIIRRNYEDGNNHTGYSSESEKIEIDEPEHYQNDLKLKHESDTLLNDHIKKKLKNLKVDYARGEASLYSESSSDDEDTDEDESEEEEIDHKWGELDLDAERTEDATHRLAACNMDWDRIRAVDLLVLFNSFLPPGGIIKSVVIYPSEFGKERMREEEIKGPVGLVDSKLSEDEEEQNNDETEEGAGYHMERLREYQLNRLKYYYAVITFDSPNSANKIYTECDGMEYESSAIKLDLRFIPDDMIFNDDPKEVCDKLPEVNKYQPRFFTTTALQQAKVNLTWDETNPDRIEIAQKLSSGKVDDITEADLQNYLASSSDEEVDGGTNNVSSDESDEGNGKNIIDKYKALLQDIEEKENSKKNDVEMEISWGIDLKEKTEKLAKQRLDNTESTPFQQYLEKRKAKKKEKRKKKIEQTNKDENNTDSDIPSDVDLNDPYFAEEFKNMEFKSKQKKKKLGKTDSIDERDNAELELLLMNEDDDSKHFNLKHIQENENESKSKKKRKNKKVVEQKSADDFEINTKDERFSALFASHQFNIDPTDPHFKKTKGMEKLINEKLKRRREDKDEESLEKVAKTENKSKAELNLLVKSVKRKANSFKNK